MVAAKHNRSQLTPERISSAYSHLRNKWAKKHKKIQERLITKHGEAIHWITHNSKQVTLGSVGGLMLLSGSVNAALSTPPSFATRHEKAFMDLDKSSFLITDLAKILPQEVHPLTDSEETAVSKILERNFGLKVSAIFLGKRLNRSYGFIGQEQHLARYPGDSIATHFQTSEDAEKFSSYGMAPGLGAWGYFAPTSDAITETDNMREKYYIAVQTFLAPGFLENVRDYISFFKYRKMLVVNPENGRGIVADIADAGPAEWTGKHLGGSPEVMQYLDRYDGAQRGPVLYFFIDDPSDNIPLGPIQVK